MGVLYTEREINAALIELRIRPDQGMVNTQEAARIFTWRAKKEQNVDHTYNPAAVRRHVQSGNVEAIKPNDRLNKYPVRKIFEIPLVPRRGIKKEDEIVREDAC